MVAGTRSEPRSTFVDEIDLDMMIGKILRSFYEELLILIQPLVVFVVLAISCQS